MTYNTKTVTNSATLVVAANAARQGIIIVNTGTPTVYIGMDSNVTAANGTPLITNASLTIDSGGTRMYLGDVYGITSSSTADVRFWEIT